MKETELAKCVMAYFSDEKHDIYPEVPCMGIIDIVVRTGNVYLSIECKMSLSFDVIEQAKKNIKYSHYAYIATPPKRNGSFAHEVCKLFGIGVFEVRTDSDGTVVKEVVKPRLNRNIHKPTLREYMKRSVAGSQNQRVTAFGVFVESMHKELCRCGSNGATPEQLFSGAHRYYEKLSYFKQNVKTYVGSGVIKNVEFREGKYYYAK